MRIGFDAKRLFHNRRGLGNFSRIMVSSLAEYYSDHEYYLYTPSDPGDNLTDDFRQMPFHIRTAHGISKWYWRSRGIISDLKKDQIDVFHGLSHEIPYGIHKSGIFTVVTVHDTIAYKYPQYFSLIDRNIYRHKLKYAVLHADLIQCISQSTAADVLQLFQVPKERIRVIPPILDKIYMVESPPIKPTRLPELYYLYVGALTKRKNLTMLLTAWDKSGTESHLILIGQGPMESHLRKLAKSLNRSQQVHILSGITQSALPAFYAHARALLYISEYEGFGLPLMEAAAASCPVITSDVSSMPEVLGDASIQVNPMDVNSVVDGIKQLEQLSNQERNSLLKKAKNHLQDYSPARVSSRIMTELYQV